MLIKYLAVVEEGSCYCVVTCYKETKRTVCSKVAVSSFSFFVKEAWIDLRAFMVIAELTNSEYWNSLLGCSNTLQRRGTQTAMKFSLIVSENFT